MKIVTLVTQMEYTPEQKAALEKCGGFTHFSVQKIKGNEIVERIGDAEVLIVGSSGVEKIDADVLSQCPHLKFISVLGVGTDFVDVKKATELGIKVSNLKGTNSESVAEHTWGMILSLSKKIMEAHNGTKEGKYRFTDYLGIEIQHKTIGILGYGEIGKRIARIAKGFDMKVLASNRSPKEAEGVEFVELHTLLEKSDVIVVTLPFTSDTENLIGMKQLNLMKENVILVNPAREQIVDKEAILKALESGKLFGFGMELDINTPADERFYKFKNVIITPHNAFFTVESEAKSCAMGVENVLKFLEGNPQNLVN
jgi:lactate dehydrogenase-like 2-hydroxyacid dehydrogenase